MSDPLFKKRFFSLLVPKVTRYFGLFAKLLILQRNPSPVLCSIHHVDKQSWCTRLSNGPVRMPSTYRWLCSTPKILPWTIAFGQHETGPFILYVNLSSNLYLWNLTPHFPVSVLLETARWFLYKSRNNLGYTTRLFILPF